MFCGAQLCVLVDDWAAARVVGRGPLHHASSPLSETSYEHNWGNLLSEGLGQSLAIESFASDGLR